jgi:thioredoxin reductase (NADPH)
MAISDWIENFPGFDEGIAGQELSQKMKEQTIACGAKLAEEEIKKIGTVPTQSIFNHRDCPYFFIETSEKKEYKALAVVIATGAQPKKMGIPGEEKFAGKGVSYCATCDAPLFKDKTVVVVGGGDTAVQEALFLAKYAKKVYLVHRRDRLRAAKILAERLAACKNIEPVWNSVLTEIKGDKKVTSVVIASPEGAKQSPCKQVLCDGVFVFAGIAPDSAIVKGLVKQDADGYIITDDDMKASAEGIFACGDVRKKLLRQIVTACGEAATAAISAQHYVEALKGTAY